MVSHIHHWKLDIDEWTMPFAYCMILDCKGKLNLIQVEDILNCYENQNRPSVTLMPLATISWIEDDTRSMDEDNECDREGKELA